MGNAMTPRTILVPLDGDAAGEATLGVAFGFAGQWRAHVVALSISPDPRDAAYLVGDVVSRETVEAILNAAEAEAKQRVATARAQFERCLKTAKAGGTDEATGTLEEVVGQDHDTVAAYGRAADLIIAQRPVDPIGSRAATILEAALFASGRPVLVPASKPSGSLATRVAVLWNDSVEATRAVAGAEPFLARAGRVDVLIAGDDAAIRASAGRLVANLLRHGVAAEIIDVVPGTRSDAEALAAKATELGATLVVMGAYGHSRLREFVLGGVTRHMLGAAAPALLLAH